MLYCEPWRLSLYTLQYFHHVVLYETSEYSAPKSGRDRLKAGGTYMLSCGLQVSRILPPIHSPPPLPTQRKLIIQTST